MTRTSLRTLRYAGCLASLLLLITIPSFGQLSPSADAYTNTASPGTNYGAQKTLNVDNPSQTTYIQFDLSAIPAGYTSSNIAKASLKLYVNTVVTAGSFNVDYVNGTWSESTITANLAPALGTTIAASVPLTKSEAHDYILIDITPAVGAWLDGTQANDGIALVGNSPFNVTFDSKENTTNSHPPELDIVFAGGGGSGITGINTAAGSGLQGGGSSGTLNLSLVTSCASGQVLEWNGSAWACASLSGGGTITGVIAGADLTGGGTSGTVTLNVDTTKVPQLASANTFTGNQTVNGNLSATGLVTGSAFNIGSNLFAYGSYANSNAFLGFAGNTGSTGNGNTGVGVGSFLFNTTGAGNAALGVNALVNNSTGSNNSASGGGALFLNTTGGNNSASGNLALSYNTTGSNNTALGYNAGPDSSHPNLSNATAIGANAVVSASNAMVLGGTGANAVNVGIGTATPAATLDVRGTGSFSGLITFASGQTFPGAGTITGVAAGTDLTGGGSSGNVTLNVDTTKVVTGITAGTDLIGGGIGGVQTLSLDTTKVPQLAAANTFTGNQTVSANLSVTGNLNTALTVSGSTVNASVFSLNGSAFAFGSTGNHNAFLGFAGNSTTTGGGNTASGYEALFSNTTGFYNTASGFEALQSNSTGAGNTASGVSGLQKNTTGSDNTASGFSALFGNTTGSNNTAIGSNALESNSTGHELTCIGLDCSAVDGLANATAIGAYAQVTESNAVVLGSINGVNGATADTSVGIGTTAPASTLDVEVAAPGLVGPILLLKNKAPVQTGTLGNSVDLRFALDGGSSIGNPNAYLRVAEDGNGQYGSWISFATMADGGAGSGALERMRITATGAVGVGTSAPTHIFQVGQGLGPAFADGWSTYSSRRWKTNIQTLPNALAKVEQLRGVSYDLKGSGKHEIGVIAEEVGQVVPEVVSYEGNGKDAQGVDYSRLTALLIEAVKQQQRQIKAQQKQMQAQSAQIRSELRQIKMQQRQIIRLSGKVAVLEAAGNKTRLASDSRSHLASATKTADRTPTNPAVEVGRHGD